MRNRRTGPRKARSRPRPRLTVVISYPLLPPSAAKAMGDVVRAFLKAVESPEALGQDCTLASVEKYIHGSRQYVEVVLRSKTDRSRLFEHVVEGFRGALGEIPVSDSYVEKVKVERK